MEHLSHPCDVNSNYRREAEERCSVLKSDLFKQCHSKVAVEEAYQDCLFDMCSCESSVKECICPIIASYADLCVGQGVFVDWRLEVRECGLHCPSGQEYNQCGDSCAHSCQAVSTALNCQSKCVEGCSCPGNQTLDEHGNCVPLSRCPCVIDDTFYKAGSVNYKPETAEVCSCHNARWICHAASASEKTQMSSVLRQCDVSLHRVLDNCPSETVTCRNMHFEHKKPGTCVPKCVCAPGYVENDDGLCIPFKECPCHHGGKSYNNDETIRQRCNTW